MPHPCVRRLALLAVPLVTTACTEPREPEVHYLVELRDPAEQAFRVTARFTTPAGEALRVALPSSRPGDPTIYDYARLVSGLTATGGRGSPLAARRLDKQTWEIRSSPAGVVEVRYQVHTDDRDPLRLSSSWVDREGGLLDAASTLVYSPGRLHAPVRLELRLPPGWRSFSTLATAPDGTLVAPGYRALVDGPVRIGRSLSELAVRSRCCAFRLVLDGGLPAAAAQSFAEPVRQAADVLGDLFGGAPFDHYDAYLQSRPDLPLGGGLEHGNAMVLNVGREWMSDLRAEALPTFVHELTHAWNGVAFHPADLHDWAFDRENYTRLSWLVEGVTSYYANLVLARAGLVEPDQALAWLASSIRAYETSPARRSTTLEEASVVEWIRPLESLDYYAGGAVAGLLLDIEIRRRTADRKSLDDVMRALYAESRMQGYRGFTQGDLLRILREQTGADLDRFLARIVDGTRERDYGTLLAPAGLTLRVAAGDARGPRYALERSDPGAPAGRTGLLAAALGR